MTWAIVSAFLRSRVGQGVMLAVVLFAAGCVRKPTETYLCSPGCFMDCQAQHMEGKAEWTREEAVETAEYCHSIRNECITCIERIEREGNACGWSKPCPGAGEN